MSDWLSPSAKRRLAADRAAKADAQAQGLPIFDAPPHNGTLTSQAAADRVDPHVDGMRRRVLEVLVAWPGMTRAEIVAHSGLKENTINGRCRELLDAGLAREDGTRDGRAILWPTPKGQAVLSEIERLDRVRAA